MDPKSLEGIALIEKPEEAQQLVDALKVMDLSEVPTSVLLGALGKAKDQIDREYAKSDADLDQKVIGTWRGIVEILRRNLSFSSLQREAEETAVETGVGSSYSRGVVGDLMRAIGAFDQVYDGRKMTGALAAERQKGSLVLSPALVRSVMDALGDEKMQGVFRGLSPDAIRDFLKDTVKIWEQFVVGTFRPKDVEYVAGRVNTYCQSGRSDRERQNPFQSAYVYMEELIRSRLFLRHDLDSDPERVTHENATLKAEAERLPGSIGDSLVVFERARLDRTVTHNGVQMHCGVAGRFDITNGHGKCITFYARPFSGSGAITINFNPETRQLILYPPNIPLNYKGSEWVLPTDSEELSKLSLDKPAVAVLREIDSLLRAIGQLR